MTKELIELGKLHSSDGDHLVPRLFINHRRLSLSQLQSNPQSIFDRIQYRLCSLPSSQTDFPFICKDNYRVNVESIVADIKRIE